MKIRSITYFFNPGWPLDDEALRRAADFIKIARPLFESASYEVQTTRLATPPLLSTLPSLLAATTIQLAYVLEKTAKDLGFEYVSLGPVLPITLGSYPLIPQILAETTNVFLSGLMTTSAGDVSLPAVRACAQVIHESATLSPDGFANLRFAALANVPPGAPFFPAAYHDDETPAFALALECADLAVQAFRGAASLAESRQNLIASIEEHACKLNDVAGELVRDFDISFGGLDFTLAPFPDFEHSVGAAMEFLGVPVVGLHGSLAAAAILADTLDRAEFTRAGFNGLMLPVLEDATLAIRAAEGRLSLNDLLLYSAVCGTGLDTIPLPGNTSVDQLNAILLDLAALSARLDKPLTARLMPIPGKASGDPTGFDFTYFANSRILEVKAEALSGLLASDETFNLRKRI